MQIRLAGHDDLATLGEVTVAAYAEFTTGPADPYLEQLADAAARAGEAELWLAEERGRALGTVTFCPPGSPWREISGPGEGEFRMLAVHPDARGRGVGGALVEHCLSRSRAWGETAMVLSSLSSMAAAHRLYRRTGFARLPARDWSPVPGVDLVVFGRDLDLSEE